MTIPAATKLFVRLTRVEKLTIVGASDARLEFLSDTTFRNELIFNGADTFEQRLQALREVFAMVNAEYDSGNPMVGV